jgi:transposase
MQLSEEQFELIEHLLPVQRGNVKLSNMQVLNGILHVAVNGCTWRALPERYGPWHTVYMRMSRWAKAGVLDRIFEELQVLSLLKVKIEAVALDSTSVKVHPDGTGALKKGAPKPSAGAVADSTPRFIWLPQVLSRSSASH